MYLCYVTSFINDADWRQFNPSLIDESFTRTARDMGGRMQFGIASALLRVGACASIILAYIIVAGRLGKRRAAYVLIGIIMTIVVFAALTSNPPASLITRALDPILVPALVKMAHCVILGNLVASFIAGLSLLAAFAAIAMPANENERVAAALQKRMRALEQTTVCCALILAILTAVNKALIDWPQAFLAKTDQEGYAYLAGAISTFWGTFGTIVLVSALGPTFVSLRRDIANAAKANGRHEMAASRWKQENRLEFDFKSGLGAAIAAAAPMLTAPGIDLASKLLH
jgi:hypothetical protein